MTRNDYERIKNIAFLRGWKCKERYVNDMVLEVELIHPYNMKENEIYYFNSHTLKRIN